ncbi:MAG: DUF4105 domain-containing protein [Bacteroidales bacterium]|nr:DUF4105 domain-containing protein [Bacteroidales bacterium]
MYNKCNLRFFFVSVLLYLITSVSAQQNGSNYEATLLTYSPGEAIYSTFGHSALRIINHTNGDDYIYNYGTFDFDEPGFFLKFAKGILPYRLSRLPAAFELQQVQKENRSVTANKINLSDEELQTLVSLLEENYLPQNRSYLYDFFYDNCATRILNIVDSASKSRFVVMGTNYTPATFKKLISPYLAPKPWAKLGAWLLMGNQAALEADFKESAFLPDYLKVYLGSKVSDTGSPLLGYDKIIIAPGALVERANIPDPQYVLGFLLLLFVFIRYTEHRNSMEYKLADWFVFLPVFLFSLLVLFLTAISKQGIYQWNANLLWLLPFPLMKIFKAKKYYGLLKIIFFSGVVYCFIQASYCPSVVLLAAVISSRMFFNVRNPEA